MSENRTKKRAALIALALLLLGGGAWLLRADPQVAKVKQMRKELFSEEARKLPPEQRRQRWQEFAREQRKLTPGQRRELWAEARQQREKEIERYFTLSKAEKTRWLDERINRMEAMRRARQASGAAAQRPPGQGRTSLSAEERGKRRRGRLDQSTPEERARRDQLRKDFEARRRQRGLPPMSGPGGFGGPR
jgi:hypothetical protein